MPDPLVSFDALITTSILAYLVAEDTLCLDMVSRSWNKATNDDVTWGQWCRNDFNLESRLAVGPSGKLQEVNHYKLAWRSWRQFGHRLGLRRTDARIYMRVLAMWAKIEEWVQQHKKSIFDSLRPGASRREFEKFEEETNRQLPDIMKMIWSIHDGQALLLDEAVDNQDRASLQQWSHQAFDGLFGGYSFYSKFVCTRMLRLRRMTKWCLSMGQRYPSHIAIAVNWDRSKTFLLDLSDDMVSVTAMHIPCVPAGGLGLLRWMEEYANRLTSGMYQVDELFPGSQESLGISLFPQNGPTTSVCITRGIETKASAIYVPEDTNSCFTYSIRLRVAKPEEFPYPRAQLHSRHWQITDGTGHTEHVHGEGVIGKYPVLYPGGFRDDEQGEEGPDVTGTFVYQSCTGRLRNIPPGQGRFGGTLEFVPGTIDDPVGHETFEVEVGSFPLAIPDFIF